jgi:hypothetical protein
VNEFRVKNIPVFFGCSITMVTEERFNDRQFLSGYLMTLDDTQRKKVAAWIAEGLKLSEIQNRLGSELGVRMTYMDVRLLVDDLKLTPKDVDPPKPIAPVAPPTATAVPAAGTPLVAPAENAGAAPGAAGGVAVVVDQIARAGAVVSGKVTFSDGKTAEWYIDQTGRLGLAPQQAGYRPPAADIQQFQAALEAELSKLGL